MTSRLFHTVVGVGLALGAMSMGCAAEQAPDAATDTAQVTSYEPATEPVTEPAAQPDRFCEVPWPTTKGSPQPTPAQAQLCIDPQRECGSYPAQPGGWNESCVPTEVAGDVTTCQFTNEFWLFCKDTGASHEWSCPSGTIKVSECVWPLNEKPERR
ncbi:MAG: hypothetical protein KIT84_08465 [Labilithrix sp.]|nr:hypothetical protein [Labilithrix sp.]MCW5811031.1 hypothetical protein [Labilithrix sp.]